MRNIKTIFLKELRRFFTEPRMLAALFLPGIILCLLYMVMGNLMETSFSISSTKPSNYDYKIALTDNYSINNSEEPILTFVFDEYLNTSERSNNAIYTFIDKNDVDEYKKKLLNNEFDLLVVFDDNFEDSVLTTTILVKPNISIFYNGSDSNSTYLYSLFTSLVNSTYTSYTINIENGELIDSNVSEEDYMMNTVMGFIIPLITISLLFSTVISICPEAIAGEKERGTLALTLLTPIKRNELAIGKILALTLVSLASGIVSFIGLIISLPKLYGEEMGLFSLFSINSFFLLLLLIITTLIVFVTLGLLVSTFSKTIKEAGSYLTPLMTILMISSIIPFTLDTTSIVYSFIPLLNIVSSMNLIITDVSNPILIPYLLITVVINLLLSTLLVFIIAKLFNNERIMFQQ